MALFGGYCYYSFPSAFVVFPCRDPVLRSEELVQVASVASGLAIAPGLTLSCPSCPEAYHRPGLTIAPVQRLGLGYCNLA